MKFTVAAVFFVFALLFANVGATESSVTPVQKVIQLLNGMLEKGKQAKHEEQVQFAAFRQFCDDTTAEKSRAVKEAAEQITILKANIQEFQAQASRLAQEIAQHEEDISTWQGDAKAAAKVRDIERADYTATHKDYSESLDAIKQAIVVLKGQSASRAQATALLQAVKRFKGVPAEQRRTIEAFLSEDPEVGLEVAAPEANAYEFQSAPVIEMLEKLEDKFMTERTTLEKEEANSRHAHELLTQDLQASVTAATNSKTEKAQARARNQQSAAQASGNLQDITSTKADDERYLSDLEATCRSKSSDFEDRQNLRTQEIQTMEKAIEILSSQAVSGAAERNLPAMLLQKSRVVRGASYVQLRGQDGSPNQLRVAAWLHEQGERLNSRVLSALAVRARDDPFAKVKKMINDLITRLMEQANEEADHKGWCDTELSTNEQTRREKSAAVESLHSEVDGLQSSIAQLGDEVASISQSVAELNAAMAKATALRQAERSKAEIVIEDAREAQSALAQAVTVLQEFYASAAQATALLQKTAAEKQEPPAVLETPYTGMQAENTGVIGLLEVIQSDFARLEAETRAAEVAAQQEYDRFSTDTAVDKAQKERDIEHKTAQRQSQSQLLTEKEADLDTTQQELDAALQYFEKLKPSCLETGTSYEDRVQRRKEEIESLQEALRILNGEDIAAVQTSMA